MIITQNQQIEQETKVLTPKHFKELTQTRGLDSKWVEVNCLSIDAKTATEHLGYKAQSDGILLRGQGYQEQFKPDKPWASTDNKKPKYRSCKDDDGYDVMLPRDPNGLIDWNDLNALKSHCYTIDGHPLIVLTEGFFKAISLTSHGVPTISVLGVEMGLTSGKKHPGGKRFLVHTLDKLALAGFGFILAFDADCATNENVIKAQRELVYELNKYKCPLYNVTGLWTEIEGKGIDDYIQMNGADKFKSDVLARAETIEKWEQQFKENENQPSKNRPIPRLVAKEIAEEFQQRFKYHNQQQTWRYWNDKYWEKYDEGSFLSAMKVILDSKNVNYKGHAFLKDVSNLLECDLRVRYWKTFDTSKYIAFNNGVLEVATGKLLEHSPGYGFVSHLPYDYQPIVVQNNILDILKAECPSVYRFMAEAMKGDERGIRKLLAVINGVIKFRFGELQQFVHLSGKPGTGKGTFLRLLQKCVGKENYQGSSLSALSSEYELASIIDKQLVVFSDERKQVGCETILKLTGGDNIRFREIRKSPGSAPFNGSVVIASNNTVFAGDTTGLDRRLCLIPFNNPIPVQKRTGELEQLMNGEISQLIAVALQLSDSEVTQLIRGYGDADIAEFKLHEWRMKMESNSVAAFFNDCLVIDPTHESRVSCLFDNYKEFCDRAGLKPLSQVKFPKALDELCSDYLGESVTWDKSRRHSHFVGLRMRDDSDDRALNYEQQLMKLAEVSQLAPVAPVDAPVDAPVKALSDEGLHQLHQLEGGTTEKNNFVQNSEPLPPEIPPTLPENLPPSTPPLKSEPSQTKKELEFIKKLQNGEILTAKEVRVVDMIRKGVAQVCGYKNKEELLKDWKQLTPYQKRCLVLAVATIKDGEKFLTKTLPRLGINPTELGLPDPNPNPSEPDGDQMSLL